MNIDYCIVLDSDRYIIINIMKLNRLLRRMMVQPTNLTRGGGGIPRPDPPINNTYSHKRIITPFDQNMWMTCGS